MISDRSAQRIRNWYAQLLHLYPRVFHERFGTQMEQTFDDLLREQTAAERNLSSFILWILVETIAGAIA